MFTINVMTTTEQRGTIMNDELGQALALVRVYDRIDEMRRAAGATRPRRGIRRRKLRGHPRP